MEPYLRATNISVCPEYISHMYGLSNRCTYTNIGRSERMARSDMRQYPMDKKIRQYQKKG